MAAHFLILRFSFFFLIFFNPGAIHAQADIKIHNLKINHLDKQNRKQGDWIFFDKDGDVRLSCLFKNDQCIGPLVFYENSDTAFVRLPLKDNREAFIFYKAGKTYCGDFFHASDSTEVIEIESDTALNENSINEIKKFQNITLAPVYYFAQKRMIDYTSAGFKSSNFIFNKCINALLTISSSGLVIKVKFPRDKNNLSGDEERELQWIYATMPRWQPFFSKNKTQAIRILITNNSGISSLSF